jgi:uncharacterized protein YecE (DUF72 family)
MAKAAPRTRARPSISIGIGSWADPEYTGVLYPKGVKAEERLQIYATWFNHVEINSTYYRTPQADVVREWVKRTPAGFLFDVKLHRAFSQSPEKTAREGRLLALFRERMQPLVKAKKLGAVLLVLPPTFGPERHRLEELDPLAERIAPQLLAVELRHSGWIAGAQRARTLDYFRERKLVWIAVDMPRVSGSTIMPPMDEVTNPRLAYLRLHGRNPRWLKAKSAAERHHYAYPPAELKELATRVRALARKAEAVHVVANNHAQDFAPKTALALQKLLKLGADAAEPVAKRPR